MIAGCVIVADPALQVPPKPNHVLHLTSNHHRFMEFFSDVGGDPLKPSLFELVAQEQLRDLLQPALKYVLSVCTTQLVQTRWRLTNAHTGVRAEVPAIHPAISEQT